MKSKWPMVRLGEVLAQDRNYLNAPEPRLYPKLSVKLYGKGVVLDAPADGAILRMKRHQLAREGQVILSEIWGKKGAIGLVPLAGEGALCTSHFFLFDVRTDRVLPEWLATVFSANYLQNHLESDAKGTTGYAAVRPATLLRAEIPVPPIGEQRRIATQVDALRTRIEAILTERDDLPSPSGAIRSTHLRLVLGDRESPRWDTARLEDVCSVFIDCDHRTPDYTEHGVFLVRPRDIKPGVLTFTGSADLASGT